MLNSDSDVSIAFHEGGQPTLNKRTTYSADKREDIHQKKGKKTSRAHKVQNGIKMEGNRKVTSKSEGKHPSIRKARRHLANHDKLKELQKTFNKGSFPSANQTAATKQKKTKDSASRINREFTNLTFHKTRRHPVNSGKLKKTQKTFNKRSFQLANQTAVTNQEGTNSSASRANREINDVKIEDDQYTVVKPDTKRSHLQQETKRYLADDEMYPEDEENPMSQDRDDKLLEAGMRVSFSNATDMETVVNLDLEREAYTQEDKVAELVSFCTRDVQCSNHATCVRTSLSQRGFCRCLPGYYGPGFFCREDM